MVLDWPELSAAIRAKRRNFLWCGEGEKPDYAPALLNLAMVAQQYLHDNALGAAKLSRVSGADAAPGKLGSGEWHRQPGAAGGGRGCKPAASQ